MRIKRFLKTLILLTLGLVALASGLNAALDRAARQPSQSSYVVYDEAGRTLVAYTGNPHEPVAIGSRRTGLSARVGRFLDRI